MNRIIKKELERELKDNKTVLIKGVRRCGKTTLAEKYANTKIDMTDRNLVQIANTKPELLLNSEKPILLDEYSNAPQIMDAAKKKANKNGDFIFTNSYNLSETEDDLLKTIEMRPMSLFESNESNGKISLKEIIDGKNEIDGIETEFDYEKIAYSLCRGGFPELIDKNIKEIIKTNNQYIEEIISEDISKIDGVKRNAKLAYDLLKTYTNQISTISSDKELINETIKEYGKVSDKTIYNYVKQLKKLFIIEEIKGWDVDFRNKTTIRLSPKKFFVDPSIGTTLMNIKAEELMMNFDLYQKLFKNLVYRDLNVYVSEFSGKIKYYQDRYGLNSDFVIETKENEHILVDVQLSDHYISDSEKHLLKLKKLMNKDGDKEKNPKAMIIITSGTQAKRLDSGILVIPIGCLKD